MGWTSGLRAVVGLPTLVRTTLPPRSVCPPVAVSRDSAVQVSDPRCSAAGQLGPVIPEHLHQDSVLLAVARPLTTVVHGIHELPQPGLTVARGDVVARHPAE